MLSIEVVKISRCSKHCVLDRLTLLYVTRLQVWVSDGYTYLICGYAAETGQTSTQMKDTEAENNITNSSKHH